MADGERSLAGTHATSLLALSTQQMPIGTRRDGYRQDSVISLVDA